MAATFVATFHGATRKDNSRNGNPTWQLHTSEGDYLTETDGSIGYEVSNRTSTRTGDSFINKRVRFVTTGRGQRVTDWSLAKD